MGKKVNQRTGGMPVIDDAYTTALERAPDLPFLGQLLLRRLAQPPPLSSKNRQSVSKKRRSHVKEEVLEVIKEVVVFNVGNKQLEDDSAEVKD